MSLNSLTIWCDVRPASPAAELIRRALDGHALLLPETPEQAGELLMEADLAFGQPNVEVLMHSSRLRWTQITSAGYTRYDRADVRKALKDRQAILTNSSSVFAEPCAQHLLAMMLSLSRQLPRYLESQLQTRQWKGGRKEQEPFLLRGQTVLLLGFGAIARRLAEMLAPFGMKLIAVRRQPAGQEPVQTVAETALDRVLPLADHVVNTLPENDDTRGFLSAERVGKLKPGARFYNIGRGATVDQGALQQALLDNRLAAAYMDVTTPEPLPPDHPLWTTPNCFITPHVGGSHPDMWPRLIEHFQANLHRFVTGQPLVDRVM